MAAKGPARLVSARFERLTGEPIESWAGLEKLLSEDVPEGPDLDYKLRPYDDPNKSKEERNDELRKDVTALANSVGGVIVLGISDKDGRPGKILGVAGSLDALEGNLGSVIRNRIWPPLDGVEIVAVQDPASSKACLAIVVPASPRAPHAVQPHGDADALKYARRVGRHTEWLSETQVADLYRSRFTAARSQVERIDQIIEGLTSRLSKRGWLLLGLVPDSPGQYVVSRERIADAERWWDSRRRLALLPPIETGPASASAGPRRIVMSRPDGLTSVSTGVYLELHDDGSCGVAFELKDGPSGNPSFYLDDLVARTLDAVVCASDFSVGQAGAGGYALITARLHFPEHQGSDIEGWDPSFGHASRLPASAREVQMTHTVDLDAVHASNAEAVSAAALIASHLAQFFGEPDARYLTPSGEIRVNQYSAPTREHLLLPRAAELDVPVDKLL